MRFERGGTRLGRCDGDGDGDGDGEGAYTARAFESRSWDGHVSNDDVMIPLLSVLLASHAGHTAFF